MKTIVDEGLCVGCGLCAETCATVFKMEDDKAIVIKNPVPEVVIEKCKEAIESCPVDAIISEE